MGFLGRVRSDTGRGRAGGSSDGVEFPGLQAGQEGRPFALIEKQDGARAVVLGVPDPDPVAAQPRDLEAAAVVAAERALLPCGPGDVFGAYAVATIITIVKQAGGNEAR